VTIKKSGQDAVAIVTDPNTGELIRKGTGEVLSDEFFSQQEEQERRAPPPELERDSKTRLGAPTSLTISDMGLSTVIGIEQTDASGNQIDPRMLMRMGRLRMWNNRSHNQPAKERSFQRAFTLLSKIKDKLGLPDHVTEKAAYIYRKAHERDLITGDSIGSILVASIYVAIRQFGVLRTLDEIAETIDVNPKQAARSYRKIVSKLDIKVPIIDYSGYISKIANNIGFDERIKRKALEILDYAKEKEALAGKDPTGVAASILYLVNLTEKSSKTQEEIARAAGVTEVTIRKRIKEFRKKLVIKQIKALKK
jgi:transcription initiation factor TFIIB